MAASFIWMKADEAGETRLERFPVAVSGPGVPNNDHTLVIRKQDIPATSVRIVELSKEGAREVFHPAPRRQFVLVLQGEIDLSTTDGSHHRLGPGDWLFADDVDSKGHRVEDVGTDPFVTFQMSLPDDWAWPATLPS